MNEMKIPTHVGIIMDGNGRWATEKGRPRTDGHREGANTLKELAIHMNDIGIKYASVYAFSTENFKRSKTEVDFLMNLFIEMFTNEFEFILSNNVRIVFSGREKPLSKKVLKAMRNIEEKSKDNTGLVLNVCLNYGSRSEIVDMTKKIASMYKSDEISLDDIDEELVRQNLYNDLPDVDLLIRTSGELRLSNFMLYQLSYAEFYFTRTFFPDFHNDEFDKAIEAFNDRNRRFGGV